MLTWLLMHIVKLIVAALRAYLTIFLVLLLAKIVTALFFSSDPFSGENEIDWTEYDTDDDEALEEGEDEESEQTQSETEEDEAEQEPAEEEQEEEDAEDEDVEEEEEEVEETDDDPGIVWTPTRARVFYIAWVILTLYHFFGSLF